MNTTQQNTPETTKTQAGVPSTTVPATPVRAKKAVTRKAPVRAKKAVTRKAPVKANTPAKAKRDAFGFSVNSKTHKATAMYLRPKGATTSEVKAALGGAHLNLLVQVERKGHRVTKEQVDEKGRKVFRYRIQMKK